MRAESYAIRHRWNDIMYFAALFRTGRSMIVASTSSLMAVAPMPAVAAPVLYTSIDLGDFGYTSYAFGINQSGVTVGGSVKQVGPGQYNQFAFMNSGSGISQINIPGAQTSQAWGINENGWVTGQFSNINFTHAFLYNGINVVDLGALGNSYSIGQAINANGWVAGRSRNLSGFERAFLHNGTNMIDLGTLGGSRSFGYGINDSGWVVGGAEVTGNSAYHAVLYKNNSAIDLGTLGGSSSFAVAVNNAGVVTGAADTTNDAGQVAFLYNGNSMINLGTLGGFQSAGLDVNEAGWVVGRSSTATTSDRAFLYIGTTMYDLNNLIVPNDPIYNTSNKLIQATGINDSGQIIANSNGRAYLLTPIEPVGADVPEPATLLVLATGIWGLVTVRRYSERSRSAVEWI